MKDYKIIYYGSPVSEVAKVFKVGAVNFSHAVHLLEMSGRNVESIGSIECFGDVENKEGG